MRARLSKTPNPIRLAQLAQQSPVPSRTLLTCLGNIHNQRVFLLKLPARQRPGLASCQSFLCDTALDLAVALGLANYPKPLAMFHRSYATLTPQGALVLYPLLTQKEPLP